MNPELVIKYTPTFVKHFRKLPAPVKTKATKREIIFRQNPFTPNLKTHRLSGKLEGYWSFSIDYHHRIVFRFVESGTILFVDAGTHSVYQ